MAVYMTKQFARFVRKNGLSDRDLCATAAAVMAGRIDADLGGGVVKQRVARPGSGKSGGFRTIVVFKMRSHVFFVYGFAKNKQDNISESELDSLRDLARLLLRYMERELQAATAIGELIEVECDAQ